MKKIFTSTTNGLGEKELKSFTLEDIEKANNVCEPLKERIKNADEQLALAGIKTYDAGFYIES